VLTVIVTIMTITGRYICAVLTVIVILTGRSICGINSYCDNTDNNGQVYMCGVNSYCDTNGKV
jgi:hypothetical protein